MRKEKMMALIVGLLMLFSVVGFAFSSSSFTGRVNTDSNQENQGSSIPQITTFMDRALTSQEIGLILQSGGIIIENFYPESCDTCQEGNSMLRDFAQKFSNFVILSEVPIQLVSTTENDGQEERLRMLSGSGDVVDLNRSELNESALLDIFCDISRAQPRECILRKI